MQRILLSLVLSVPVAPAVFAGEAAGSAAALIQPEIGKPGEKIASEDSVLRNFHTVDIGMDGEKIYRSASPVRELVKGVDSPQKDPGLMAHAGQIMGHIKELGIMTIISLEDPSDTKKNGKKSVSVAVEKAAARSAGIAFLSHPMRNANFKDMAPKDILAWLQGVKKDIDLSAKKGGVLFHCAAGHDRTGLVAAYLRITVNKWPVGRAIEEMRDMGHNWVKYSSNGGKSSWHEEFLKRQFGFAVEKEAVAVPAEK